MLHKTKAIILRSVKYGETSLVVTAYTEAFGLQSYMVNGIRTTSKQGGSKAGYFQPASILDVVVYHNEQKNLQRIKEFKAAYLYQQLQTDIFKNAVALFMVELMTKCIREPEENPDLFHFIEDALIHLDQATPVQTANFPLFFALHVPVFFGFRMNDRTSSDQDYLDLREGNFSAMEPNHPDFIEDGDKVIERFTEENSPLLSNDVKQITINQETGEVFIATEKGIISFRGFATAAKEENNRLLIFPNPVPPGFTGQIAISGVTENSIVKITELNGQLVHQVRALGGQAVWNGKDLKGRAVSSGVYLVFVIDERKQEKLAGKIVFIGR